MKSARENAKAQAQRRHLTPPPPHRRADASAGTAAPEPPNLAIVPPSGADSDKAAKSASTSPPARPPTQPAHTPDPPPRTVGPTPDYLATKAVSDAALAWAAQTRKLALREDSLARAIRAARHAGVDPSALRAAIAAAETKAADRLDPAALTELLK